MPGSRLDGDKAAIRSQPFQTLHSWLCSPPSSAQSTLAARYLLPALPAQGNNFLALNPKDLAPSFLCNTKELLCDVAVQGCVGAAMRCDTKLLISGSALLWASTAGQQLEPAPGLCPASPPAQGQLCLPIPLVTEAALAGCILSEQSTPAGLTPVPAAPARLQEHLWSHHCSPSHPAKAPSVSQSLPWESLCREQLLKAGPDVVHAWRGHSGSLQRDKQPCQMSPIKLQVLYFNNKP